MVYRTIAGFCKYAIEEELLDHSPAAHVRRPRLDYESHATALDRNELGGLLVAAGLEAVGFSAFHAACVTAPFCFAQHVLQDLSRRGLRQFRRDLDVTRDLIAGNLGARMRDQVLRGGAGSSPQPHVCLRALTPPVVGWRACTAARWPAGRSAQCD